MPFYAILYAAVVYGAPPFLLQLFVNLFTKRNWIKILPIILMALFWLTNIILAFLTILPMSVIENWATHYLSDGFVFKNDQHIFAVIGFFMLLVQSLAFPAAMLIRKIYHTFKRNHT